jgi:7-cyano-7-deazaguanine synthase
VTSLPQPAVVLLSGGMDSATVLAEAKLAGFAPYALSFSYGQRHAIEIDAARRVAKALGATSHRVVNIDLAAFGGSALTAAIPVPKDRNAEEIGTGVPVTYVPARNTIFLAYALAEAEVLEASNIFIGVNAVDYSGYPDCRPEYIEAFQQMARLGTRLNKLVIHSPLAAMSKAEIVKRGLELGVDFSITRTCYDPNGIGAACRLCDACKLRLAGFAEAGVEDPAPYARAADS